MQPIDSHQLVLLLTPVVALDLLMKILAVRSWLRTSATRGPRLMWLFVILLVNGLGWIAWFMIGRADESA